MPYVGESRVVDFDADAAVDALREDGDAYLGSVAEYDRNEVNLLYASDVVVSSFGDVDGVEEFAEDFHDHVAHDFYERELFVDLVPMSGSPNGFVTTLEHAYVVRYLTGDEGVFVSTSRDASLDAIFDALDRTIG